MAESFSIVGQGSSGADSGAPIEPGSAKAGDTIFFEGNHGIQSGVVVSAAPNGFFLANDEFVGKALVVDPPLKRGDPAGTNLPLPIEANSVTTAKSDFRIRLKAQRAQRDQVYGKALRSPMKILHETDGMIFPYTPTIAFTQNVEYRAMEMMHTNQDFYYYARTPSIELTVTGDFTVQNYREGIYALACIHFLRTASKMYFGKTDITNAGLPPPVLIFSGYGNYLFNDLRVLLKSHTYTFDKAMDTITVNAADGGVAKIPALFQITVTLIVQNTPNRWRNEFDLNAFRRGDLMNQSTGWI